MSLYSILFVTYKLPTVNTSILPIVTFKLLIKLLLLLYKFATVRFVIFSFNTDILANVE